MPAVAIVTCDIQAHILALGPGRRCRPVKSLNLPVPVLSITMARVKHQVEISSHQKQKPTDGATHQARELGADGLVGVYLQRRAACSLKQ